MTQPIIDLFALTGRAAIVTGGAGPLGTVIAETLAELGSSVIVVDRPGADPEAGAEALGRYGGRHLGIVADLAVDGACEEVIATVEEKYGRLDIVVNNAALTGGSDLPGYVAPFAEQSAEAFMVASRLNVVAPFLLVQRAQTLLEQSPSGSVINLSSIYGLVAPNMSLYEGTAMGNPAAYGATKAGLAHLTRYMATVLGPHIRANAIAPGGIARGQSADFVERYERLTPLRRMASEDDFRGVIAWLAGDASAYVTGQVIAVDGGWTAW